MPRTKYVAGPRAIAVRVAAVTLIAIGYLDLVRGGPGGAPGAWVIGSGAQRPRARGAD